MIRWTSTTHTTAKCRPTALIAKVPNIAAQAYRYNKGLPFSYPKNGLTYPRTSCT